MPAVEISFHNPAMRREYEANLPTSQERVQNFSSILTHCANYDECGNTDSRSEMKVCSQCKSVKYCSQDCQKAHWRKHKKHCATPDQLAASKNLPLRLAERALAAPVLVDQFHTIAVTVLDLLTDRANWMRYAMHFVCATGPADLSLYVRNLINGNGADETAPICLRVARTERLLLEDLPEGIHGAALAMREKTAATVHSGRPLITFWFTAEGGADDLSFTATLPLPLEAVSWLDSNPKNTITRRSAMTGDTEVPRTEELLRESINSVIRQDRDNRMHLRVSPSRTS